MKEVLLFFLPRYGILSKRTFILACTIGVAVLVSGGWMSYYAHAYAQKFPAHLQIDNQTFGGQNTDAVYEDLSKKLTAKK